MNGFDASQHNAAPNSTSASNTNGGTASSQTLHLKRESLNGSSSFVDDGAGVNNGGGGSGNSSANHTPSQIPSVSSVSSTASDRMRSSSSEPLIHSGISSTTPVWSPNVHHPAYDFDVYTSQLNGNLGSTSCCIGPSNGNGPTLPHSHLSQGANSYSPYYGSGAASHESAVSAASTRPCKPTVSKFWSNSYDSVNGASPQMPSDHSSIMAAAVCHPSAFAAAAAHHAAAANHSAASAWFSYPTYSNPTSRSDPYLPEMDPRAAFVDSATYAHHTAIGMRMSAASEQSCTNGSTSVTSWTQPTNGVPPSSANNSTSK